MRYRSNPTSDRLLFDRVAEDDFKPFHTLITDAHIKAFLFDDKTMNETWTRSAIKDSQMLFETQGIGIWLLSLQTGGTKIGFCGFRHFPRYGEEPQLLYAFQKTHCGNGYATECARAMLEYARKHTQKRRLESAVDSPNLAS